MHPVIFLIPALGLILGPRLWVKHVLNKHNRVDEDVSTTAGEFARELLDRHGLQMVRVESTDIGDHYDPQARAVRLARDKFDRKTLTALTTASHEVGHAIQHASDYGPFVWRNRSVKVAQVTGDIAAVLFLSVPAAALLGRNPLPPAVIGLSALAMLGTSVVAQLAALPSELDASFGKAMPMLKQSRIDKTRYKAAHQILLACSLTYVASSMVAILYIWPWIGGAVIRRRPVVVRRVGLMSHAPPGESKRNRRSSMEMVLSHSRASKDPLPSRVDSLIRGLVRLTGGFQVTQS